MSSFHVAFQVVPTGHKVCGLRKAAMPSFHVGIQVVSTGHKVCELEATMLSVCQVVLPTSCSANVVMSETFVHS